MPSLGLRAPPLKGPCKRSSRPCRAIGPPSMTSGAQFAGGFAETIYGNQLGGSLHNAAPDQLQGRQKTVQTLPPRSSGRGPNVTGGFSHRPSRLSPQSKTPPTAAAAVDGRRPQRQIGGVCGASGGGSRTGGGSGGADLKVYPITERVSSQSKI